MRSKIKMDVNGDNQPFIYFECNHSTEDVRDKIFQNFSKQGKVLSNENMNPLSNLIPEFQLLMMKREVVFTGAYDAEGNCNKFSGYIIEPVASLEQIELLFLTLRGYLDSKKTEEPA